VQTPLAGRPVDRRVRDLPHSPKSSSAKRDHEWRQSNPWMELAAEGLRLPSECKSACILGRLSPLLKYSVRNINNHMAHWKVIALVSGNIEAVSGPSAQDRPGAHEWIVWEGEAADKAEALKCAEQADPRVDLEWMRIRYERDLNVR